MSTIVIVNCTIIKPFRKVEFDVLVTCLDPTFAHRADELQAEWFNGRQRVGLTAGASAPEILVRQVIDRIKALGAVSVRKMDGIQETIKFPLPKGLKADGGGDASN